MTLMEQFLAGGFFMYFILAFLILTIAFIFERFYALYATYKDTPKDLFSKNRQRVLGKGDRIKKQAAKR